MASSNDGWPKWIKDFDERRARKAGEGGGGKGLLGGLLGTWMDEARGASTSRRSQAPMGDVARMHGELDPWPALVRAMGDGNMLHRLVMGSGGANGNLALTHQRRNLLALGPPRSAKTVGVL